MAAAAAESASRAGDATRMRSSGGAGADSGARVRAAARRRRRAQHARAYGGRPQHRATAAALRRRLRRRAGLSSTPSARSRALPRPVAPCSGGRGDHAGGAQNWTRPAPTAPLLGAPRPRQPQPRARPPSRRRLAPLLLVTAVLLLLSVSHELSVRVKVVGAMAAPPRGLPSGQLPPMPALDAALRQKMRGPTVYSNWVIPGRVMVGAYPGMLDDKLNDKSLRVFLKLGIDTFCCLQAEVDNSLAERIWRTGRAIVCSGGGAPMRCAQPVAGEDKNDGRRHSCWQAKGCARTSSTLNASARRLCSGGTRLLLTATWYVCVCARPNALSSARTHTRARTTRRADARPPLPSDKHSPCLSACDSALCPCGAPVCYTRTHARAHTHTRAGEHIPHTHMICAG